jgi:hypothetical protein
LAKQTINIGATPNDGTGDPIRDAFDKINQNFTEVYTSYNPSGQVAVGNSTVNTVISNTGGLVVSNTLVSTVANTATLKVGNSIGNAVLTSSLLGIYGNTAAGNSTVNTSAIALGNSSVNTVHTVTALTINAATVGASLNASALYVGNSVVNATVNSSVLSINAVAVTSNSLTMGSSNVGTANFANGFSRLPNGLLMQWGYNAAVNSTANVVTFSSTGGVAFTNVFSISATSTTANHVFVSAANTTTVTLVCNSTANTGVYWSAIGK